MRKLWPGDRRGGHFSGGLFRRLPAVRNRASYVRQIEESATWPPFRKQTLRRRPPQSDPTKIDRNSPASSESSLGAESIRWGRPSTNDSVVEAMDEETPGLAGNRRLRTVNRCGQRCLRILPRRLDQSITRADVLVCSTFRVMLS
jgi:hypothetical protein